MLKMSQMTDEDMNDDHNRDFDAGRLHNLVTGAWVEMLESEKSDLVNRIQDLERKVNEQNDEIVCLRATLADTLRRVAQLESCRFLSPPASTATTPKVTATLTPTRSLTTIMQNGPSHYKPHTQQTTAITPSPVQTTAVRSRYRLSVHESNNSLNSSVDSSNSSTDSPIQNTNQHLNSNFYLVKRWSSTGDFNQQHLAITPTRVAKLSSSTRSLLNLNSKLNFKYGTKDTVYNMEEGTVTVYFRDKPVTFHIANEYLNNYDMCKVQTAPNFKLHLDWVYGYRGRDSRANLQLLPTGELIYFVSTIIVLYNVEEQQQRHYLGHTDDVKCMSVHPNKLLIATGQSASILGTKRSSKVHIRVWNSVNLHTISVIGMDYFEQTISCLAFSKADGGQLLAAVDESSEHSITLWSWQNGHRLAENKCCPETVLVIDFHPYDNNVLITCGKSHVNFWSIDVNHTLYKRMGVFEMREKPKYVTAIAFSQNGDIITGDSNGTILFWTKNQNKYQRVIKRVHNGPIFSICALRDGCFMTGGGKDGRIVSFTNMWIPCTGDEIQIEAHFGGVRVIAKGRGSQIIVGTTRNCILIGSLSLGFQPIIMGHTDELFALDRHPTLPQFVTGGFDNLLQMWDSMSHIVVWSKDIGHAICAVSFSVLKDVSTEVVAVACKNGQWFVLDTLTREIICKSSDGIEPLLCVQFAPNNQYLAFGSADHSIYVYQVTDLCQKYLKIGKCVGHTSSVIRLDWSTDGQFLRSNGIDYEVFYWNAMTCRQLLNESKIHEIQWTTNHCILSFETLGALPENITEPMVTSTNCNNNLKLLASGDDCGTIKLFTYPTIQPKSLSFNIKTHRNEVSNVTFLSDDSRLISIGASDTLVAQWSLVAVVGAPNNNSIHDNI